MKKDNGTLCFIGSIGIILLAFIIAGIVERVL